MDWNNHYATLFKDYLEAVPEDRGAAFEGVPVSCSTDAEELARPGISVICESQESNHRSIFAGGVKITLHTRVELDGDQVETAAEMLEDLESYLNDLDAWAAFIQGLHVEQRKGWVILHRVVEPGIDVEREKEAHTLDQTITVRIRALAKR